MLDQDDLIKLAALEEKWGMDFHPQKCSVRLSRAKTPMTFQYKLKGTILTEKRTTEYLGVDIQANLASNCHINTVTKKVNSMLGFLRHASEETKTQTYVSMVRSNLDYYCTISKPHYQNQKHQVGMVKSKRAPFVTNRYRNTSSVRVMLDYHGRETHESRRIKLQLTVLYKTVHDLISILSSSYLKPIDNSSQFIQIPIVPYINSFFFPSSAFFLRNIHIWNRLPATVAETPSPEFFKREPSDLTF